jgi:hypothetical protein
MKFKFFSLLALVVGFTACNNDSNTTASTTDSSSMTATDGTATTATSTVDYAAMADSVERNSQQGYYLNPRTGKAYSNLKVDRSTGRVSTEAGEPVWRYVDKRNWWVYGYDNNNWNQMGTAKMEGDRLMYQGDDGSSWMDYDARWKADDDRMMNTMNDTSNMNSDGTSNGVKVKDDGNKVKDGDLKIKTDKDGDIKIKDKKTGEKVKYDADDKKIKTDN